MDCCGDAKIVYQLAHDLSGHEQRIPFGIDAIIRDATSKAPFFEGMLIYFDEHHLNEEGAKRYAAAAREAIAKIILKDG